MEKKPPSYLFHLKTIHTTFHRFTITERLAIVSPVMLISELIQCVEAFIVWNSRLNDPSLEQVH